MKVTVVKGPMFEKIEKEVYRKLYKIIMENANKSQGGK